MGITLVVPWFFHLVNCFDTCHHRVCFGERRKGACFGEVHMCARCCPHVVWCRWYVYQPFQKRRRHQSTEERVLAKAVAVGIELPAIKEVCIAASSQRTQTQHTCSCGRQLSWHHDNLLMVVMRTTFCEHKLVSALHQEQDARSGIGQAKPLSVIIHQQSHGARPKSR